MEQKIQDYGTDGSAIYRTGVHSYEVRTSYGTGSGATVAEALKDLANQQVEEKPKKKRKSKKVGKLQFDVGINPETELIEPSNLREVDAES